MAYTKGTAYSFEDLITKVITFVTDKDVHGDDAWELVRNEPYPKGTIIKCHGFKENEKFYIGLLNQQIIKNETYPKWFFKKENLAKHFLWKIHDGTAFGRDFVVQDDSNDPIKKNINFSGITYSFTERPDIFASSANVLSFGVFKQFSDLNWNEQAGGIEFNEDLPFCIGQYRQSNSYGVFNFTLPLMPGIGYPSFGMDIDGPSNGYLRYWLTKDRHRLIIVIDNGGRWESAYLGFLEPYDNSEYSFPATIIGGTSGIKIVGQDFFSAPGQQISPQSIPGLQFDYSPDNWSLVHGIVPFATAAIDNIYCPTQAMVMLPDGQWQGFANYVQGIDKVAKHTCNSPPREYMYLRSEPVRPININHFIRPLENNDVTGFNNVYEDETDKYSYKLDPIEFVEGSPNTNMLGRLWNVYYPSGPVIKYGEIKINNKLHLMLPNVWEDRKFHIKGYGGIINDYDAEALLKEDKRLTKLSKQMKLIIRLEE